LNNLIFIVYPASSNDKKENSSPYILTLIKKCSKYNISYELMCNLNFYDLQYLIIEYEIENLQEVLRRKETERLSSLGLEVVDATDEDILRMHSC